MCINSTDDLYIFGGNEFGQLGLDDFIDRGKPIKHPSLSNVIDISSGGCSTFVKTSNGIYAFGLNEYLQLGVKTNDRCEHGPIQVFQDNEDIWFSNPRKSKAKSARN